MAAKIPIESFTCPVDWPELSITIYMLCAWGTVRWVYVMPHLYLHLYSNVLSRIPLELNLICVRFQNAFIVFKLFLPHLYNQRQLCDDLDNEMRNTWMKLRMPFVEWILSVWTQRSTNAHFTSETICSLFNDFF